MDSNLRRVHYQCLNLCQEKKRLSIRKKKGCGKMRPKIEKMATICMLTFGSFLCMMGLIRQNAEAVSEWNIEIVDTAGDVGKYNSIAKHDSLRAMVRIILLPVVGMSWIALKIGPASTMGLVLLFIACFLGFILNLLISVE